MGWTYPRGCLAFHHTSALHLLVKNTFLWSYILEVSDLSSQKFTIIMTSYESCINHGVIRNLARYCSAADCFCITQVFLFALGLEVGFHCTFPTKRTYGREFFMPMHAQGAFLRVLHIDTCSLLEFCSSLYCSSHDVNTYVLLTTDCGSFLFSRLRAMKDGGISAEVDFGQATLQF